jgi:hypothetical protein
VATARAAAAMGGATDAAQGGVGGATLGTGAAVDVAGVARGATENAECGGVGQLSDPLEGHVIKPTLRITSKLEEDAESQEANNAQLFCNLI